LRVRFVVSSTPDREKTIVGLVDVLLAYILTLLQSTKKHDYLFSFFAQDVYLMM